MKEDEMPEQAADETLKQVIAKQATEDEAPLSKTFTLRKILGGDILSAQVIRRQIWLCLLYTSDAADD